MSVTIKDIARAAGVSHSTVSRALHNHPALSPETVARVQAIAAQLGYMPSAVARGLRNQRSQVLGVVLDTLDDPFFGRVLEGIEDVLQPRGYSTFVAASRHDPDRERSIVRAMVERRVDGVIVCAPPLLPEHGHHFQDYGLPLAVINNQDAEDYQYSIYHDDRYGAAEVARYLIGLGHRQIAYLGNSAAGRTDADRRQGYLTELQAAGLAPGEGFQWSEPGGRAEDGYRAAGYFLDLPQPPTAIMCFNDMLALGLMRGLQQAGLAIPRDCSVAGFDDVAIAAYTQPPLTTLHQPKYRLGAEAARLMLELLALPRGGQQNEQPRVIVLRGRLLVRASTAAPGRDEGVRPADDE
jgi:DNA-binding LacI/PurR family transcriptional regulator